MKALIKVVVVLLVVTMTLLGLARLPELARCGVNEAEKWLNETYNRLFIRRVVVPETVFVEKEQDYGDGINGLINRYSKENGIPAAIMKSVVWQESSGDFSNMSFAIADKYQKEGKSFKPGPIRWKYAAYGLCGLTPAFTMDLCGYDDVAAIWGPEAVVFHLECCAKRLRQDYNRAKGHTEKDRWDNALVYYYGDRADGYQAKVLARAFQFALEREG